MEAQGLTTKEAKTRLAIYGRNEIVRTKKVSPLTILLAQFKSPLLLLLILSALALGILGSATGESHTLDVSLILIIVAISAISGFVQDYKAERSIEALQQMATPHALVLRDGERVRVSATELVPGDLVLLEAGDVIPADARLIDSNNAKADESVLTGESVPVRRKTGDPIFMNTYLIMGNAQAVIEQTGMKTKVGQIASTLETITQEKTPFTREMEKLSKNLFWIVIVIAVVTAGAGMLRYSPYHSILSAVALAVAAIPEGLPAVLVLSLAAGARTMADKKALVRRLSVVESMGSVNVICTDKTGTLTKDEMEVLTIYANQQTIPVPKARAQDIRELLLCSALNNNTKEVHGESEKRIVGDETEVALRALAEKFDFHADQLTDHKRVHEIPFEEHRKRMSVITETAGRRTLYAKGAPEVILESCSYININGKTRAITSSDKKKIRAQNDQFAQDALRVLALAYKPHTGKLPGNERDDEKAETRLIFLGLVGIKDPPRDGVHQAIAECATAGIRVIMLTGDNPLTAQAIAREIGIGTPQALTGADIDKLTNEQLRTALGNGTNVFARLDPAHKLRIMDTLQKEGNIVAMTGDGVNDALALKKADVGIAMGVRGTDVAKQASDLILLDDNFITIVEAVREGRRIFDNIRKFVNYLLTSNFAEVAVVFLATAFMTLEYPILLPVQLLWINLLTDGFPALALGIDPAHQGIMQEPPRKRGEGVINPRTAWNITLVGLGMAVLLFATYFFASDDQLVARTALFTGFILYEFVRIAAIRSQEHLTWRSNPYLVASLVASLVLQLAIIYTPARELFTLATLPLGAWVVLLGGVAAGFVGALVVTRVVGRFVNN